MQRSRKIIRNKKTSGGDGAMVKTMGEVEDIIETNKELVKKLRSLNTKADKISKRRYFFSSKKGPDLKKVLDSMLDIFNKRKISIEDLTIEEYEYWNVERKIKEAEFNPFDEVLLPKDLIVGNSYYGISSLKDPNFLGKYLGEGTIESGDMYQPISTEKVYKFVNDSGLREDSEYKFIEVTEAANQPGGSRKTRRYRKSKAKGMKKRSRTKK